MSTVNAPFGLRPVNGLLNMSAVTVAMDSAIPSGFGTNIFQYAPVTVTAAGQLAPVTNGTQAILGSFVGLEYTDVTGRRRNSNYWPAGLTLFAGGTALSTAMRAYIVASDLTVFEVQLNGTMAAGMIGDEINFLAADLTPPAGNAISGRSTARGDNTPITGTVQGQLQITGLGREIDNTPTDAFPIVRVRISRPQVAAPWLAVA